MAREAEDVERREGHGATRLRARAAAIGQRLWPRTLFGRLVLVLASGMLAAQFLTSSIWLRMRDQQLLDLPTQLLAERVADVITQLESPHAQSLEQVLRAYQNPIFSLTVQPLPVMSTAIPATEVRLLQAQTRLDAVLEQRMQQPSSARMLSLRLLDAQGQDADWMAMLGFERLSAVLAVQFQAPDGRWLLARMRMVQVVPEDGWTVLGDLIWRVYLLRILIVVLLVMLAVRWVVEPLRRLARAARSIEQDVQAAPTLPEVGPLEVRQAVEAFNRMRQRLARNLDERSRFLASVSHDLRSPMARMRLRLELAEQDGDWASVKEKLVRDLAMMDSLIDSTLAYLRAGERHLRREPVDLQRLLVDVGQDWCGLGHAVRWQVDATLRGKPVWVQAHALSLRRALDNLISNAVRYAGHAELRLTERDGHGLLLVCDDGPGIAPAMLEQVLQPFVRGEQSRNADTGGHGLGLSVVAAVAEAHGGRLRLCNRTPGPGLQAELWLKRLVPEPAGGGAGPPP